jgi:formamidopyrimidine-DNA glycosylase
VPELPDVAAYVHALQARVLGEPLERIRIASPFLLRTTEPPPAMLAGKRVREVTRIGKRIALVLDDDYAAIVHLMIAGRLHWRSSGARLAGRNTLAAFDFPNGSLVLTEAGTKRRASLELTRGRDALRALDRGGIDVFASDLARFRATLARENHTLKRALTDPHLIDGIGNAYSDEILHAAKLSPLALTQKLDEAQWRRLYDATRSTLQAWTERLIAEAGEDFPEGVTAFRPEMAVHGRFAEACPACGDAVQRIRYAENETNYCPTCQTGGRRLADRALSRLLK